MAERIVATVKTLETKHKCPNSCKQNPGFNSSGSPAERVLQLQRTAGNQAVQKLIKSGALQAKLKIGQPNDVYEQEADRVAEQVMRMPGSVIQRKPAKYKKDKKKILQTKESTGQEMTTHDQSIPPIVHEVLRSPGQPLNIETRRFMESRFSYNFSNVRVHTDAKAAESARAVDALAYTVGRDVVLGEKGYTPETATGRKLLAHELTHVIQQSKSGLSLSTLRIGSPHDNIEAEASAASEQMISGNLVNLAQFTPAQHLQRAYVEEPAAGCGICENATETGKRAHTLVQSLFPKFSSLAAEKIVYNPDDEENMRLDLLDIQKSPTPPYEVFVSIGEIKPYNTNGVKRGYKDLEFYKREIETSQIISGISRSSFEVGLLDIPAPKMSLEFKDPTSKCFGQALIVEKPKDDGLYLYSCQPPRSSYPKKECCGGPEFYPLPYPVEKEAEEKERKKVDKITPEFIPIQIPAPARSPVPQATPTRFNTEQLKNYLINIGIPITLVTIVIYLIGVAVADPEPFSKLGASLAALLGISIVAATALSQKILREVRPERREET